MIISTIKTITNVLFTWLIYLIGMLPIINCIVVVWWLFNLQNRDKSFERHRNLTYAIYISAFFTLWLVLGIGIEKTLFIIPRSWGSYDEEGEWSSYRSSLAGILSFIGAIIVVSIFHQYEELTNKVERLEEEKYKIEDEYKELKETLEAELEEDGEDDEYL